MDGIKKRLIPFKLLPAAWGLKGKTREIAQAEYELEDYPLEIRLAEINYDGDALIREKLKIESNYNKLTQYEYAVSLAILDHTGDKLKERLLEIEYAYANITKYEYDQKLAELTSLPEDLPERLLDIEIAHNKITEKEYDYKLAELRNCPFMKLDAQLKHHDISVNKYEKEWATLNNEPWVSPLTLIPTDNAKIGSFELDWNDAMIEFLIESGYIAPEPEDVIDLWLTDICKSIALEELAGTGYFDEQADQSLELKRKRLNNGKTEVS